MDSVACIAVTDDDGEDNDGDGMMDDNVVVDDNEYDKDHDGDGVTDNNVVVNDNVDDHGDGDDDEGDGATDDDGNNDCDGATGTMRSTTGGQQNNKLTV